MRFWKPSCIWSRLPKARRTRRCGLSFSIPGSTRIAASSSWSPKRASDLGYIECQGFVYPNRRFTLKLRPGERLDAVMVTKGDRVKAGQPLARIVDPSLPAKYLDLTTRKNDYSILQDEIEALTLEITLHRDAVRRVAVRIENLQKLKETLPDYPIDKEAEPFI